MKITGSGVTVNHEDGVVVMTCPCGATIRSREVGDAPAALNITAGAIEFAGFPVGPEGIKCPTCGKMAIKVEP